MIVLFSALAAFAYYINSHWRPFLTQQIQEAISTSTDSLYHISFKKINVNVLTGSASLKGISFNPDTLIYQKLIKQGKAPKHLYRVEVSKLELNRLNPWKVYFQKSLILKSIIIENPAVDMIYQKTDIPQDTVMDNRSAYLRLSKYLKSIDVESILFRDADFKYIDKSAPRRQVTSLKNFNIRISGLLIDSMSQYDKSKLYYTKDISVSLRDYSYRTSDNMYDLKLKEFTASTSHKYAKLKGFRIVPRYGAMEFSKIATDRKQRYSVRVDEAFLENINYRMFNSQRKLRASKLSISNSMMSVFVNTEIKESGTKSIKKLPQKALQDFDLTTWLDTVALNNIQINYSEYNAESQRRGTVHFNEIEGNLYNISNDSAALKINHFCKASITCLLMARGRLDLNVNFDLSDKNSAFTYRGKLGLMKPQVLNKAIKPLALVEIRSGLIKDMIFDGSGDIYKNKGKVALRYNGLKVKLLQKKEGDSRLKTMNIATMAANILILKSDNPSYSEKLRVASYQYMRPPDASFFNMLWKGLFMGIQETVGLDEKTQQMIAAKMKQYQKEKIQRDKRRRERSERKDNRQQP
ncbi:hypothetical protein [Daejeonella oryzae]|uniref:hypothetical protein n=1 Tax=Daejeonella oryzae TaxID=1122943 RepID=UPI000411BDBA|nr:hypothetical protein [Daejeonella oryzae]